MEQKSFLIKNCKNFYSPKIGDYRIIENGLGNFEIQQFKVLGNTPRRSGVKKWIIYQSKDLSTYSTLEEARKVLSNLNKIKNDKNKEKEIVNIFYE